MYEGRQTIAILDDFDLANTVKFEPSEFTFKWDYVPVSLGIYCNVCSKVWAKMHVEGGSGWTFIPHVCMTCGGGNLLNLHLEYRDFTIPDALLSRELDLYYSRGCKLPYSSSVYV